MEKELALISSYIVWADLLDGTFFQTFDKAYELAQEFVELYPPNVSWETLDKEWDETLEEFVKEKIQNR